MSTLLSPLFLPSRAGLAQVVRELEIAREKVRMDFLSDPNNKFSYAIKANGQCLVEQPWPVLAKDLRAAIDWIIENPKKRH